MRVAPALKVIAALAAVGFGLFWLRELDRRAFAALAQHEGANSSHAGAADLMTTELSARGSVIHLDRGVVPHALGAGWSTSERGLGVWSADTTATLELVRLPPGGPATLTLTVQPFTAPTLPAQRVRVSAGGRVLAETTLAGPGFRPLSVVLPAEAQSPAGATEIELALPDADSPAHRTPGATDPRRLGVLLKSIAVER